MTWFEDPPLSPLDEEIETLLRRLAALEASPPEPFQRAIHEVACQAIRDRLRDLSRKCSDRTCRIRVIQAAQEASETPRQGEGEPAEEEVAPEGS